jgi:putative tryptophan/tyrosine transport system substrate-binding protein
MIGGAACALTDVAHAHAAGNRALIAFLSNGPEAGNWVLAAFLDGLRDFGHFQGQDFDIVARFSGVGQNERLPALAEELVRMKPDLILATAVPCALAAVKATRSIPIVVGILWNPVGFGLAASEARPGGNVTGILEAPPGLSGKELELALEILPSATKVGLLADGGEVTTAMQQSEITAAAAARGIKISTADAHTEADIEKAFSSLVREQVQGVIVLRGTMFFTNSGRIADLAAAAHLPSVWGWPDSVATGGLVGYGVDLPASIRRTGYFVDRIMKGTLAGDLPIEFPKTMVMAVNLKTAAALGLTIPPSVLVRADKVIE